MIAKTSVHVAPSRRSLRRRLGGALVVTGVLSFSGVATWAQWSDTSATSVELSASTVGLQIDSQDASLAPVEVSFPLSNLIPGRPTQRSFALTNTGTMPATVSLQTTTTGGLAGLASQMTGQVIFDGARPMGSAILGMNLSSPVTIPVGGTTNVTIALVVDARAPSTYAGSTETVTFIFVATGA